MATNRVGTALAELVALLPACSSCGGAVALDLGAGSVVLLHRPGCSTREDEAWQGEWQREVARRLRSQNGRSRLRVATGAH